MKFLYVAESMPNRDPVRGDGSAMIPFEVIRNLPPSAEVTLLTFRSDLATPQAVAERCSRVLVLERRAAWCALGRSVLGRHQPGAQQRRTRQAVAIVRRLSGEHDATLLHGPHVAFLARHVRGPVVLQTVDPWSIRMAMEAELATGPRAAYRALKVRQSRGLERHLPARVRLLTVGARDAVAWSALLGRTVGSIPNGVDLSPRPPRAPGPPVVCFVGSLNYGPNIDSATTLVERVAPLIWQRLPDTRIVLAGREPVREVLDLVRPRVDVLPNVASVTSVFDSSDLALFPDEHGVGIRNSVREALAAGLPVLATPAAAREQPEHPLLSVEVDLEALAARAVALLQTARQGDRGREDGASEGGSSDERAERSERTWSQVSVDYLNELRHAAAAGQPHLALVR